MTESDFESLGQEIIPMVKETEKGMFRGSMGMAVCYYMHLI